MRASGQLGRELPRDPLDSLKRKSQPAAHEGGQLKGKKQMKYRFAWASAVTLALTVSSQLQSSAITNGVIVISTRTASDALYRQISSSSLYDSDDYKGPGAISPGDAGMAISAPGLWIRHTRRSGMVAST